MTTTPWKSKSEIESNPIGLSDETVRTLAPQLDEHVASMFVLFHQYQKHHWLVEGPQFHDVHVVLEGYYTAIHADVDAIAERMTALGAVPTGAPSAQDSIAYIEHEPEGVFRLRDMLERDKQAEGTIAQKLRATIAEASKLGDYGTETLLKNVLTRVEDRAHHLEHYLGDDSLGLGLQG